MCKLRGKSSLSEHQKQIIRPTRPVTHVQGWLSYTAVVQYGTLSTDILLVSTVCVCFMFYLSLGHEPDSNKCMQLIPTHTLTLAIILSLNLLLTLIFVTGSH